MSKKKKKRAKYGTGSIRRRKNGTFEYRVPCEDEYGNKDRKSFYGQSDVECIEKAKAFIEEKEKESQGLDLTLTIPQIAKMIVEKDYKENHMRVQGYTRNLETIKIIENAPLGSVPIVNVTEKMLEDFFESILNYSDSTIEKVFRKIKVAFRWALIHGLITKNLIEFYEIRRPQSNKKTKEVSPLSFDDEKKIIDYLMDFSTYKYRNNYSLQLIIEMSTGLRMGEINALRLKDIDLENKVINVCGTISRGLDNKPFLSDTTKTKKGIRQVPIIDVLLPFMIIAVNQYQNNKYELLFYDQIHDKMITTQQVNNFFSRICKKLNIVCDGQHSLRHTFTTRAREVELDPDKLKDILGHSNIHMTMDVYNKNSLDSLRSGMEKVNEYYKKLFN